jgi:phage terminase Nu1 subunit (DNA packaging protein)
MKGGGKMIKKNEVIDGVIVGTAIICDLFGLSSRRVRELAHEGIFDRVKNGSYELVPTTKKYINYLKIKSDGKIDNNSSEQNYLLEKMLHEKAKRQIAELELAQMKGTMHKAEDVEKVMGNMLTAFRTKILNIPTKIAPHLIAQNEISLIQDIIQKEIYEVLTELGNYDPELFHGDKYVEVEVEVEAD